MNGTEASHVLFAPVILAGRSLRNRVVMASMTTRLADEEGYVTEDTIAYYRARARGGVGLITVEMAAPERVGRHRQRELGIYHDRFLPGLARLVAILKSEGAAVSIQLGHGGGHTREDVCGATPIAPSAIPHHVYEVTDATVIPIEMDAARIEETVAAYVTAARRARTAGFDFVEVQGCHGYLISQFLTPFENRRSDAYGGSLANRARFGLEILRRLRAEVPELPVIYRMTADDFFPGGIVFEEACDLARWIAEAGAAALHVSAGHYRSLPSAERMIPPMAYPEGVFLDFAARIRQLVTIPVIAVGRLGNPILAKAALDEGKADFIALGRPLIADPDWVGKASGGQPVWRCIACNTCLNDMRGGARLGCVVNARAGGERQMPAVSPIRGERICVIGAGPAGLTFASLVAANNAVTVMERNDSPGGALRAAAKAPYFQDVKAAEEPLVAFIVEAERACRLNGVKFSYNTDPTRDPELLAGFERIVVASGARYKSPLDRVAHWVLDRGVQSFAIARRLFRNQHLRNWIYYRARRATGSAIASLAGPTQRVHVIGDARSPGKAKEAIATAFEAALRP
jgi:2,4-dienoyl-CoA reductase-like NADH-dependent reductase (Old Yellow Enzyme family)